MAVSARADYALDTPAGGALPVGPRLPRGLARRLERLHFDLLIRPRFNRLALDRVAGQPLLVLPHVFHPGLAAGTRFFLEVLAGVAFAPDERVLVLGSGSGVCALAVAPRVAAVVASDINPYAVRCSRINVLLAGLEERVSVRRGDLFAAAPGERFDRVLFHPPFDPAAPAIWLDHATRGGDVLARFAAGLPAHLSERGEALVILRLDAGLAPFAAALAAAGCSARELARRRTWSAAYTVWSLRRNDPGGGPAPS
jgi:methylase of polypeptide subunit release factors